MGEVVNLRVVRKAKARLEKQAAAQSNRLKHGRTKSARELQEKQDENTARQLDGHKRTQILPNE